MANTRRKAAWEYFGEELKRRREEAGLTQTQLGDRVFVSGGYIGQFEQAFRKPQLDVAIRIDEVLRTGGFFERTWHKLIRERRFASYFEEVAELERTATKICDFAPLVVPGLLQTEAYNRALMTEDDPFATEEQMQDTIDARMERAQILADATRPEFWVILHEHVLRTPVGGPSTMADQLDRIVARIRERTVLVTIIPYAKGAHASMNGMFRLMEFDDAPPVAYTETEFSGTLIDEPAVVKRAQRTYDLLRVAALSPEASLELIASAAEDHRRCVRTT
ncbi:helix-turn-helix domain-containing protein [Streptomyces cavernicola]|uniref:Helix-turn-helix transcriptional regulator n=1 Tax=Streptomyces cavernicola TaxID=3043613 RepID=A0ABT6SDN9_9ACTN|nr:helix-turn-helix transcriptional regulator [Streptomyces sp. B-S-A6]MDI3406308.1 helix-turn-helix transcriptional regulator [Streptomyces sp. B-S-A6]